MNFRSQPDPTTLLPHVEKHAFSFFGDLLERGMQLVSAVAPARTKHIARQTFAVDPNQGGTRWRNLAFDQGQMVAPVQDRSIKMQIEVAIVGG